MSASKKPQNCLDDDNIKLIPCKVNKKIFNYFMILELQKSFSFVLKPNFRNKIKFYD